MPSYFRFLTLMAFNVFKEEEVRNLVCNSIVKMCNLSRLFFRLYYFLDFLVFSIGLRLARLLWPVKMHLLHMDSSRSKFNV